MMQKFQTDGYEDLNRSYRKRWERVIQMLSNMTIF